MKNSKLIEFLKTLSANEMSEFGRFLNSGSRREAKNLTIFYNYLKKYHPHFPEKKIDKATVAQKVFPQDPNNGKKILNLMYKMNVLLEDFFIQEELKERTIEKNFLLLNALKKRKLDKHFFKKINQIEEEWEKDTPQGIQQFYNDYRLKEMRFSHPNYSLVNEQPVSIEDLITQIDKHYFAVKLYNTLCLYNNQNYVVNQDKDSNNIVYLIPEITTLCSKSDFQKIPQLQLFSELMKAFEQNDFQVYPKLKEEFLNHLNVYKRKEKNDLLIFLSHACYQNYKLGKPNALQELFELNRFGVEQGLILEDGYIPAEPFWGIVHMGCAVKELEWTETFIQKYGSFLPKNQQTDTLIICNALLTFNKGDFEEAIKILRTIRFQNFLYGLYAKSIQLQCYYELDNYEELFLNLIRSFHMFLNRKDAFADGTRAAFSNFIFFCKQLQRAKHHPAPDLTTLTQQIQEQPNIAYKAWIKQKLDELKAKNPSLH